MSFKLLAIRPLKGCNSKFLKNLKEDRIYQFYKDYKFIQDDNGNVIGYDYEPSFPEKFYNINDTQINISAIVGKNGSGKSSVVELLYMAFYNIALKNKILDHKSQSQNEIISLIENIYTLNIKDDNKEYLVKCTKKYFSDNYFTQIDFDKVEISIKELEKTLINTSNFSSAGTILDEQNQIKENNDKFQSLKEIFYSTNLYLDDLNVEIYYFQNDNLYCIKLIETNVLFKSYDRVKEKFVEIEYNSLDVLNKSLFYNLGINYSLYALNSKEIGTWIRHIFHKNDSYQTPIVLNPYREDGKININSENYLVRSRLATNLLDLENNLLQITEYNKIDNLVIEYDLDKIKNTIENESIFRIIFTDPDGTDIIDLVNKVIKVFLNKEIDFSHVNLINVDDYLASYIFDKIIKIPKQYKSYRRFKFDEISESLVYPIGFDQYLELLKKDKSHITLKLRQAINFLYFNHDDNYANDSVYKHFKLEDNKFIISIKVLADELTDRMNNYNKDCLQANRIQLIELLPPSFFYIDYEFENKSFFSQLSSGEKQKIFTINSLLYHLSNLNSVHGNNTDLLSYENVNIILDEIELYYHPEMQRTFIDDLITSLSKVNIENIKNLNFIFITHSPFILSDISNKNIMFLQIEKEIDKYGRPILNEYGKDQFFSRCKERDKTFGANIHDLLADSFFMGNGYIGEFATKKIQDLITYLNNKDSILFTQIEAEMIIKSIGDFIIRDRLQDMFDNKFSVERNGTDYERFIESEYNKLFKK